jgi:FAD:protein FMN transferase
LTLFSLGFFKRNLFNRAIPSARAIRFTALLLRARYYLYRKKESYLTYAAIGLAILIGPYGFGQKYSFVENKMGSPFGIIISCQDSTGLGEIVKQSFALVDKMNKIFSDYDPNSEVSKVDKLPANVWHDISPHLYTLLTYSQEAYYTSYKSFDVTLGAITKEWRRAKRENRSPDKKIIQDLSKYIGCDKFELNQKGPSILKKNPKFQFDFGGIAKGYIADEVARYLISKGYPRHLIDAGGDLVCGAAPISSQGWKINLHHANTEQFYKSITIANKAIATSGMTYQYIESDSKERLSHIIDPIGKKPISNRKNVTVIAPKGMMADWLATASSILTENKIKRIEKKYKGLIKVERYD